MARAISKIYAKILFRQRFLDITIFFYTYCMILDNDLVGEGFVPDPNDPFIIDGDEIVNGKLVKDTLSGDFCLAHEGWFLLSV